MADQDHKTTELTDIYKSYFKRAIEGIMILHQDLSIHLTNPAAENMLGYNSGELCSKSLIDLIPKDHEKQLAEILETFKDTKHKINEIKTTLPFLNKEGKKLIMEIKVSNHFLSMGMPQLLLLFSDVTEKHNTHSRLEEVQGLYENALETIGDAFVCLDHQWYYKYANSIAKNYLKELVPDKNYFHDTLWNIFPNLVGTRFETLFKKVMESRNSDRIEIKLPISDLWMEIRICPYDKGIAFLSRDISELKKKEAQLKESKELFTKAFHSSPLALSISKFPNGGFIEINTSFLNLFGYSNESEIIGKTPMELKLIDPDNRLKLQQVADKMLKSGNATNIEINVKKKDLTPIDVLFSAELIDFNGEQHILATMIDITQKKESEKITLRLNEYLEKTVREKTIELTKALEKEKENNDLKSRFVSTASHEFRTPLTGLLTSVSILEQYTHADNHDKLSKHFSRIKASVTTLTDILNDFLSLDKLERGKIETACSSFDLRNLIQQTMEEINNNLKKGQKIKYTHSGDSLLHQDKKVLKNTLMNLLSNASKYSSENKQIEIYSVIEEDTVKISIKDKGIGIPEKDQQNLFTLFFRAKNAEMTQGTGLGLNIVKKYLTILDGTIEFSSVENEGSTFTIIIPQNKN